MGKRGLSISKEVVLDVYLSDLKPIEISKRYKLSIRTVGRIRSGIDPYKKIIRHTERYKSGGVVKKRKKTNVKPQQKKSEYAGMVECLGPCGKMFYSLNKRKYRFCKSCKKENERITDDCIYFMCE